MIKLVNKIHSRNKKNIVISILAMMIMLAAILPGTTFSGEYRRVKPEWVMPENYPGWFHGWGKIGYFEGNEIVINDMDYRLSNSVKFHTPEHELASRYEFSVGKLAGFLFDENGEIVSLWLITKKN